MQQKTQTMSLPTDKFLTVAINLLNKAFLENNRTDAKRIYREIEEGKTVPLTRLEMEDKSQVRIDLVLDHREYKGKLRFTSFRTGLTLLIAQVADSLREETPFRTFQNENNPGSILFGFTAVTAEDDIPSVLLLGADSRQGHPSILLRLAYFDFRQFEEHIAASEGAVAGVSGAEEENVQGENV
ncbi:MAG: hypothetical protein AAF098_14385 [Pseudomonadota bacterium]